jgi:hypothetical protein
MKKPKNPPPAVVVQGRPKKPPVWKVEHNVLVKFE